uniref:Uncharacterized protein n=1 Tax=Odontella aurita TaxID=265563 RepID=A0A7S4IAJ8_9STRA
MGAVLTHMNEAIVGPTQSEPLSKTSKFLMAQGCIYAVMGLNFLLVPELFAKLFMFEITGDSAPWRLLGMEVSVISYFYIMSARANSRYFATTTVLDRVVLCPVLVLATYVGAPPLLCYSCAFLELLLAILTSMSISADDDKAEKKST